ncbi:S8 family serine peptidase [Rhodocytophaga aerolata]|uniref:S8 family serine peptidase n=1 Tax=Rhodocytophaga aerolata TaxID=455078 RepID=A0ABT8R701_9BACT|nr:S8 family serine peptidase [Rhodocytophaga aerolata]MDO1447890.1 S8 family serine peptidase [Rhodocytophaga aerolata]
MRKPLIGLQVTSVRSFSRTFVAAVALAVTACSEPSSTDVAPDITSAQARVSAEKAGNKYIVVLKADPTISSEAPYQERLVKVKGRGAGLLKAHGANENAIEHVYGKALEGFSATLSAQEVKALKNDNRVAYIEPDQVVTLAKPGSSGGGSTSQEIPWGIARVKGGLDASQSGKTAWVIDTGIDLTHPDLNVDASRSVTFITSGRDADTPNDFNGHGSHVAGTIGAKNNSTGVIGVAAGAKVAAVKVLNSQGSGSYSGVIKGVDYVAANGKAGDVANMSLGGPVSTALDDAVLRASAKGILFALAAGNESDHTSNHSPGRVNGSNIYTVSAMGSGDKWASFSNFGNPPVDYCAPGVGIKSTWKSGGYNTISGTSMATPHVAGILLLKGRITIDKYVQGDPDGKADPIASAGTLQ